MNYLKTKLSLGCLSLFLVTFCTELQTVLTVLYCIILVDMAASFLLFHLPEHWEFLKAELSCNSSLCYEDASQCQNKTREISKWML